MTSTVDCNESEIASALLNVASDLLSVHVGDVVGSPLLNYGPSHVSNPVLGTKGRYSTIGVTGVLENLIATHKHGIDPVSSILKRSIVNVVLAEVPLG